MQNAQTNALRTLFVTAATALSLSACASMHPDQKLSTSFVPAITPLSDAEIKRQTTVGQLLDDATFGETMCEIAADKHTDKRIACPVLVAEFKSNYSNYITTYGSNKGLEPGVTRYVDFMLKANLPAGNDNPRCWTNDGSTLACETPAAAQTSLTAGSEVFGDLIDKAVASNANRTGASSADQVSVSAVPSMPQVNWALYGVTDGKLQTRGARIVASKKRAASAVPAVQGAVQPAAQPAKVVPPATPAIVKASANTNTNTNTVTNRSTTSAKNSTGRDTNNMEKGLLTLGLLGALGGVGFFGLLRQAQKARHEEGIRDRNLLGQPKKAENPKKTAPFNLVSIEEPVMAKAPAPAFAGGMGAGARAMHDVEMPAHHESDFGGLIMHGPWQPKKSSAGEIIKVVAPRVLIGLGIGGAFGFVAGGIATAALTLVAAPVVGTMLDAVAVGAASGLIGGAAGNFAVNLFCVNNKKQGWQWKSLATGAASGLVFGGVAGAAVHFIQGLTAGIHAAHGAVAAPHTSAPVQAPVAHTTPVQAQLHTTPVSLAPMPHVTNLAGVNFNDTQLAHLTPDIIRAAHGNAHQQVWALKEAATQMTKLAEHSTNAAAQAQNYAVMDNALHAGSAIAQQHHITTVAAKLINADLGSAFVKTIEATRLGVHQMVAQAGTLRPALG